MFGGLTGSSFRRVIGASTGISTSTRWRGPFKWVVPQPVVPDAHTLILENGIRIATERRATELVYVAAYVRCGPRYEKPTENGYTHVVERIAFQSNKKLKWPVFEKFIKQLPARIDIKTTREWQLFTVTTFPKQLNEVLQILALIFTEVDHHYLTNSYTYIERELMEADVNPKSIVFDYLHQSAFQGTSLGQAVIGPEKNIKSVSPTNLKCFLSNNYCADRLTVAVSSNLNAHDVCDMVCKQFSILPDTARCMKLPRRYTGSEVRFRDDTMQHLHMALAVEVCGYSSVCSHLCLLLMQSMLGRYHATMGNSERLWPAFAHASGVGGICEYYSPFYICYSDVGLWGVYLVVDKSIEADDTLQILQDSFKQLCVTVSEADVDRGKAVLLTRLARRMEGPIGAVQEMGIQMMYLGLLMPLCELRKMVLSLNVQNVRDMADSVLYDQCPVLAAVGPVETVPDYTRTRANMYWIRF